MPFILALIFHISDRYASSSSTLNLSMDMKSAPLTLSVDTASQKLNLRSYACVPTFKGKSQNPEKALSVGNFYKVPSRQPIFYRENGDFFLGGDFTWYGTGHANWARVDDRRVLVDGILFRFPNIPLPDFLHFHFSLSCFPTFIFYPCLLVYSELAVFNMRGIFPNQFSRWLGRYRYC